MHDLCRYYCHNFWSELDYEEIKIINTEGKRLLKLTNELLKYNNLNKETNIEFEIFNLFRTLQMVLKIYEKELKKFTIYTNYEDNIIVIANKAQIEQVLFNFLTNSIQHAEKEIILSVKEFEKEVKISIENDGKEIKEDDVKKVWGKYFTTRENGTGLGLYVCKEILDRHNSKYNIENTLTGVRINFTLKKYINET